MWSPAESQEIVALSAADDCVSARFWMQRLARKYFQNANEIVIRTGENSPVGMCFITVADPKTVKDYVHLNLTTSAAGRDQEIDHPLAPGVRRGESGQTGAESRTVLATLR
jgi:hypothetical protein